MGFIVGNPGNTISGLTWDQNLYPPAPSLLVGILTSTGATYSVYTNATEYTAAGTAGTFKLIYKIQIPFWVGAGGVVKVSFDSYNASSNNYKLCSCLTTPLTPIGTSLTIFHNFVN